MQAQQQNDTTTQSIVYIATVCLLNMQQSIVTHTVHAILADLRHIHTNQLYALATLAAHRITKTNKLTETASKVTTSACSGHNSQAAISNSMHPEHMSTYTIKQREEEELGGVRNKTVINKK